MKQSALGVLIAWGLLGCASQTGESEALVTSDQPMSPVSEGGQWSEEDTAKSVFDLEGPRPRNLLVISIDTLRRDKIGRYDGTTRTPFLDGRLSDAVVLDDHRSCSNWTYSAMICAMTGQSTVDHGFEPSGVNPGQQEAPDPSGVPEDLPSLPHWMSTAGYATSLVSTTRYLSDETPLGVGFETVRFEEDAAASEIVELTTTAVEPLLAGTSPWYLHVHLRDPHHPYSAPSNYQVGLESLEPTGFNLFTESGLNAVEEAWPQLSTTEQALVLDWLQGLYDAEVRYLDQQLSYLWLWLGSVGALEDTLVVFFTDHGEQFFEHGELTHAKTLYEEEVGAVAAFWARNLAPVSYTGPTSHRDLVPGILEVLGLEQPESVSGSSPGVMGGDQPRFAFWGPQGRVPINTVDDEGLRLYYTWSGELQLFDRFQDPLEQEDLYGTRESRLLERHLLGEVVRNQEYVTWAEPIGLPR